MSEARPPTPPTPSDLLDLWRQQAAQMEQRWNEYLNQVMGTEAFAQVMARSMEGFLALQATYGRAMEQYLRALNLPTRTDITQLAERVARIEQQIADLPAVLAQRDPGRALTPQPSPARRARDSRGRYVSDVVGPAEGERGDQTSSAEQPAS